jgi:hypothetical protein
MGNVKLISWPTIAFKVLNETGTQPYVFTKNGGSGTKFRSEGAAAKRERVSWRLLIAVGWWFGLGVVGGLW